ncbi:MAG: hypothetical protein PVF27_00265, partial [Gemmatimonadales bacterium]
MTFAPGRWVFLCALLAASAPLHAQQDTTAVVPPGTPVVVRGDTLFHLVGTLGPFTPEERADGLRRRIEQLADDPLTDPSAITVRDTSGVTDVVLGGVVVLTVTERDAADAGMPRQELAARWGDRIREAIESRGGAADLRSILWGALLTMLTTAGLVVVLKLL